MHLNAFDLNSLDTSLFQAFYKTFKTYDKATIGYCMYFMNVLPPRSEYNLSSKNLNS